ncbi:MAG: BLUF domain-containing protein [Pseudomonadota bacterium]
MIRQLVYISSSIDRDPHPVMPDVLSKARANNEANGITGVLLFSGGTFLQVLEGAQEMVERTFRRISADSRHKRVMVLIDHEIEERVFERWSMGWKQLNADDPLSSQIKRVIDERDIEKRDNANSAVVDTLIQSFLTNYRD